MPLFAARFLSEVHEVDEPPPGVYDPALALWLDASGVPLTSARDLMPTRASKDVDVLAAFSGSEAELTVARVPLPPKTTASRDKDRGPFATWNDISTSQK